MNTQGLIPRCYLANKYYRNDGIDRLTIAYYTLSCVARETRQSETMKRKPEKKKTRRSEKCVTDKSSQQQIEREKKKRHTCASQRLFQCGCEIMCVFDVSVCVINNRNSKNTLFICCAPTKRNR